MVPAQVWLPDGRQTREGISPKMEDRFWGNRFWGDGAWGGSRLGLQLLLATGALDDFAQILIPDHHFGFAVGTGKLRHRMDSMGKIK